MYGGQCADKKTDTSEDPDYEDATGKPSSSESTAHPDGLLDCRELTRAQMRQNLTVIGGMNGNKLVPEDAWRARVFSTPDILHRFLFNFITVRS